MFMYTCVCASVSVLYVCAFVREREWEKEHMCFPDINTILWQKHGNNYHMSFSSYCLLYLFARSVPLSVLVLLLLYALRTFEITKSHYKVIMINMVNFCKGQYQLWQQCLIISLKKNYSVFSVSWKVVSPHYSFQKRSILVPKCNGAFTSGTEFLLN